jgi:tetratricopeptide (TPR) repeat protein
MAPEPPSESGARETEPSQQAGDDPPAFARGLGLAQFERALRYPSQGLLVTRFCGGLLLALVLLTGLVYVIGHGSFGSEGSLLHALTKAIGLTGVSVALAIPLLILAGWCIRRLWLQYLAWSPGTIQVPEFTCVTQPEGFTPAQLTTQFRNTLSTLRLQTDSPSPGAQPPSDFLDVLSKDSALQGAVSETSIAQVAAFLRATFPPTALIVRGALVTRQHPSKRCCGVSLQVMRLPNQGSLLKDVWDKDWESAVRRAANSTIAAILPRTRRCKGPWVTWRGYVMKPSVFGAYEDAARLDSDRRYYGALRCCYRALEGDPLNRAVRLQLGKLQEQLGLYLEALGTYQSILIAGRPAEHGLPRRLYKRRARRERQRQADIARYRQIVLLSGNSIVEQWRRVRTLAHEDPYRRETERLLREFCEQPFDLGTCDNDQLSRAFCERARDEAATLRRALRIWRLTHLERNPHLLARTVAVTGACIAERLAVLDSSPTPRSAMAIHERLSVMDGRLRRCGRWTGLRTFQSHYNAACLYALPLKDEYRSDMNGDREARSLLAQRAIRQLRVAASFADSAFLGSRRNWLLGEDPDLDGLRNQFEFATFVSTYFPMPSITQRRWIAAQDLGELYTHKLLRNMAPLPAAGWDKRHTTPKTERIGRSLSDWWRDEAALWAPVSSVVSNPVDWRSHLSLLDALHISSSQFVAPRFERFAPEKEEGERIKMRLVRLGALLSSRAETLLPSSDGAVDPKLAWLAEHASDVSDPVFETACERRAEVWRRMNAFLGGTEAEETDLHNSLSRAIEEVADAESSWGHS